jgi:hypothetical protein
MSYKHELSYIVWIIIPLINSLLFYYSLQYIKQFWCYLLLFIAGLIVFIIVTSYIPRRFGIETSLLIETFYSFSIIGFGLTSTNVIFTGLGSASLVLYYQYTINKLNKEIVEQLRTANKHIKRNIKK